MKKKYLDLRKNQQGEVMIEASIILVSLLLLLMALLSISFMFYQQAMMNSVATEIASDVAKNYKYTDLAMGDNELTVDDAETIRMFRMNFGANKIEHLQEIRAEEYAAWRLPLTSLGFNPENIIVKCEITGSGIGRAYVKVTVSQKTDFFLSDILSLLEISEKKSMFSATAYAECVDLTAYTSMVNFTEYASKKLSLFNSVGNLYGSVKNLVGKLLD